MIPQLVNIIAGFILGSPKLKEWGGKGFFEKIEKLLHPYTTPIGWATLIVGVLALLDRLDITIISRSLIDGSFPQAIPLILIGLILLKNFFKKYSKANEIIIKIEPYQIWIGLWGILAGLVSILFGCPVC